MPKVSLIIAAYNIEDYIEKCIDSLTNQTFYETEIIIVNDGSTDNTLKIVENLSKIDSRIKIINKKNEGAIEARESGFKVARGEYVLFIDGDDWLDRNAISILYNKAKEDNFDIVCYKFYKAYDNGEIVRQNQSYYQYQDETMVDNKIFLRWVMTNVIPPSMWSKFIKKSFITDNNIPFPRKIAIAEDLAFMCTLGIHSPKVYTLNEHLYFYYQRETSVTKKVSSKILDRIKATQYIKEQLKKHNLYLKYKSEFEYLVFIHNFYCIISIIYGDKIYGRKLYKEWKKKGINIYNNKYYKKLIINEPIKVRIATRLFERNYMIGRIYSKIKIMN
ncbi:glycosyltransferase family 2 protein [Metabacillus litoralis]|uniref:glycosyltransferase family 2 protein n=1 Tax=Metabacillus litoralis TaxID=152268 RepID=UPI001CFF4DFF|nr:glycosyltransferase family 2 protein [Metabacillus litoralis]